MQKEDIVLVEEELLKLQADMAAPPIQSVPSSSTAAAHLDPRNSNVQAALKFVKHELRFRQAREISAHEIQRLEQGFDSQSSVSARASSSSSRSLTAPPASLERPFENDGQTFA